MTNEEIVRIDVTLVPSEPLFSAVIDASQAVTDSYENMNIIDAERFPPHVSLHICTFPKARLTELAASFKSMEDDIDLKPLLKPTELIMGSKGYISLQVEVSPELRLLHQKAIEAVSNLRDGVIDDEPWWLREYSYEDQSNFRKYGNMYVLDRFNTHFSIAKVSYRDRVPAYKVASQVLRQMPEVPTKVLQICDIGMRNEKWEVLYSF